MLYRLGSIKAQARSLKARMRLKLGKNRLVSITRYEELIRTMRRRVHKKRSVGKMHLVSFT